MVVGEEVVRGEVVVQKKKRIYNGWGKRSSRWVSMIILLL